MTDTVGDFTFCLLVDAGIAGGMRVLDIGCGTGGVALLVGNLVGAQGAVVGVDPDADSLATARDRACERHRPNVTFA
ncbi:MAG TPA: methyltransferase domain-containing protein [Acetobacteraceae bacterium]|nr:methyltransferase domain-containing protein [Acetobacteraceae bacterium]